jgi:hypothetical protein
MSRIRNFLPLYVSVTADCECLEPKENGRSGQTPATLRDSVLAIPLGFVPLFTHHHLKER